MYKLVDKKPDHETSYQRIKEMILFGEFVPGQSLTIHGLTSVIDAGVTPVREAIRRLVAEGALTTLENRRVVVPQMTIHRLEQIELGRLSLEPELAKIGARKSDFALAEDLERLDALVNKSIDTGDIGMYLNANYQFHNQLYLAADAPILQRIVDSLWLQVGPSLRIVCGRFGTANILDQHREATAALRQGDCDAVGRAVYEDIKQGMGFVRKTLVKRQPEKTC